MRSWQLLPALAAAVLASKPDEVVPILSCADVECPVTNRSATCKVTTDEFRFIGAANLTTTTEELEPLSLVKATGFDQRDDGQVTVHQTFYLGTPKNYDFGSMVACALFFREINSTVWTNDTDRLGGHSDCKGYISTECVSAMTVRAQKVLEGYKGIAGEAACKKLQEDFEENFDPACSETAADAEWKGIWASTLSGNGSRKPITEKQNETSNCWPILPKDNDLTAILHYKPTGSQKLAAAQRDLLGITPVLTVFMDNSSNPSVQSEAQLTCLKAIDLNTETKKTLSPNAAGRVAGGMMAAWVGLMSVAFAMFLA